MKAMKRKRLEGRITKLLVVVMLFELVLTTHGTVMAANVKQSTSRAIYVVFDNSGSMYGPGNMAWSQATYAMEVFAAMTNFENGDQMKIFPMHPVTTDGTAGKTKSSITVSDQKGIEQIHNMYTPRPVGTPYTQTNNAAKELGKLLDDGKVDEGWLIVLTDGDFDADIPKDGLKGDLTKKAESRSNMYVQYLAIGKEVKKIPDGNEQVGFYAQKAEDSSAVVNELAEISNRIFKRNEYKEYKKGDELVFDVPLSKLIVFAQGKDVNIVSLKNKEGGEVNIQSTCEVSYSNTDGAGITSYITETPTKDKTLKGQVATFADASSIVEGTYTLDVEGADSIKVYYEPDVQFGIGLFNGEKQVDEATIEGGSYSLKVGFVNQLSGEFIENSTLLGETHYFVKINGDDYEIKNNEGAHIVVPLEVSGDSLSVEAGVTYLNNYSDEAAFSWKVCTLEMEVDSPKGVKVKELENEANSICVKAMKNGQMLTEEQWENATVEVQVFDENEEEFPIEYEITKGKEVSTWVISLKYKNGDLFSTGIGKADFVVSVVTEIEGENYGSAKRISIKITDDKNLVDFIQRYWKEILISLVILAVILGYVPPIKKRFATKMKKRPSIECTAEKIGIHDMIVKGNFEKDIWTVIAPYIPETGRLTFSPAPVKKTAKVRSTGGSGMVIVNTNAFKGKEDITFNGMSIPDTYKGNYRISASTIISVATPEFTYTCIPNVQKMADGSIKRGKRKKR